MVFSSPKPPQKKAQFNFGDVWRKNMENVWTQDPWECLCTSDKFGSAVGFRNAHSVSIRMRRMMAYLLTNHCWTPHWAWASDVPAKMDSHSPQWKFRVVESPNKSSTNHHWLVISTHISILCWLKPLFGRCLKNTMKWRTNGRNGPVDRSTVIWRPRHSRSMAARKSSASSG